MVYNKPCLKIYCEKSFEKIFGLIQTQYQEEPEQAQVQFSIQSIEFSQLDNENPLTLKPEKNIT